MPYAFYGRNDERIPSAWIDRMRAAMSELPYAFSAHRMVSDYARRFYYVGDEVVVEAV